MYNVSTQTHMLFPPGPLRITALQRRMKIVLWSLMICGVLQIGVANVRGINLSFVELFRLYC